MKSSKFVLWGILTILLAGSARAQNEIDPDMMRVWARSQQSALEGFSRFSTQADVHHVVETGGTKREASILLQYSGDPAEMRHRPEVLEFVLNGDTLDTSEGRRVQQGLTSMMSPDIRPLLYGFSSPSQAVRRMRQVGDPTFETVDGDEWVRFDLVSDAPEGGPPMSGDRRPPVRQEPPGFRRPRSGQRVPPPPGERPGSRPGVGPDGGPSPFERISYWFDMETGRLTMTSSEFVLPGRRVMTVMMRYERINGVDVPVWRTIKGSFPMQRRLRTITANLEQETLYSGYTFTK